MGRRNWKLEFRNQKNLNINVTIARMFGWGNIGALYDKIDLIGTLGDIDEGEFCFDFCWIVRVDIDHGLFK